MAAGPPVLNRARAPVTSVTRAILGVIGAVGVLMMAASTSVVVLGQMATADRLQAAGWWPTKGTALRTDYIGASTCARCHPAHSATQPTTSMARTATRAHDSEVLRARNHLTLGRGPYSYEIVTTDRQSLYSVRAGTQASSALLTWAFGVGRVGQTFLFERDGAIHEARVSYYDSPRSLDFTPGRAAPPPRDIVEAMSRQVPGSEARRCFACHTTSPSAGGTFEPEAATPGITCEACHGPGRRHVDAMAERRTLEGRRSIVNPATFEPADSVDFCGACHATFWDVTLAGDKGIAALRSQPYRLMSSRCWNGGDARITCVACHNPHQPLIQAASAYDARCASCHRKAGDEPTRERAAPPCKVGNAGCVTCHMAKYEVPEMQHSFTDHLIRVVRARP
jgi:hypothetical protein